MSPLFRTFLGSTTPQRLAGSPVVLTQQPAKPASLLAPQLGFQSPTAAGVEASGLLLREVTTISNFTHKW